MKKLVAALLAAVLLFCLFGCGEAPALPQETTVPEEELTGPVIAICLPEESAFWQSVAIRLEIHLQTGNYRTQVQYAENNPQLQAQQLRALAEAQVGGLVITPVDAMALSDELLAVKNAGIPVVAFDRLPLGTQWVDALVTFDYMDMGRRVGEYIVENKALETAEGESRSYNIELFMGSAEDHTALLFHTGLMRALQPYLDAGVLKCPSGRTSFADTYILLSDPAVAGQKLTATLENFYSKKTLDIVCFATDDMASGCKDILAAYSEGKVITPLVTGVGGGLTGLQQIVDGTQTVTVYQDYDALATSCAQVVDDLLSQRGVTADAFIDNHALEVPALLQPVQIVDSENYQALLIDTGIYSVEDLNIPE